MKLEMLATNSFEMWTMVFFLLIGIGSLLFSHKGEMIFAGVVALGGITVIAYNNHSHYIAERYLMKQFHEGNAFVCGMWRGESIKVDPSNGWKYEERVGFIKADVIINDAGVCSVIGKSFPKPSSVPYWMTFVGMTGILLILRFAIIGTKEESNDDRSK